MVPGRKHKQGAGLHTATCQVVPKLARNAHLETDHVRGIPHGQLHDHASSTSNWTKIDRAKRDIETIRRCFMGSWTRMPVAP
jgi:hypothetical protein